ncbi:enoyl-CoA hydratase-related protein, partial [Litorivivens sp.]|uniref:enoyl-CoA hydratase-related protein n=1 Tax=Litorivivens sp. TaxID=2020868 RepID=UPI0035699267
YFVNGEEAYLSDIDDFLIKSDGLIGEIFKSRKDINSIILLKNDEMGKITRRVHPSLDDLAQIIGTSVRISDDSSPSNILGALKKRYGCYILGYGGLALGRDLEEALAAIRILQKSAHVELCGNNIKYLSYIDCLLMNYVYKHKYSKANSDTLELPDYPANEKEIRNEIVECGKTLVNEGIVQGTWGNISVRISPTEMLITPSGMDYYSVSDKDIVKLDLKTMEYGDQRKPSGEKKLHQMIVENNQTLFETFLDCPKPILVAMNGPAIGASVTSATLCNGIIASEKATFSTPFAALGIKPEGCSSVHFPRLMGEANAQRMLGPEGWKPTAAEALEVGLVQWVVPDDQLQREAYKIAREGVDNEVPRAFLGGSQREELKAVNARESIELADAFLSAPFFKEQARFMWGKNKKSSAALFYSLGALRPLWARFL